MLARKIQPMSAEEFLREFEGVEGKWELVDGEPRMMAGGSIRHADVALNISTALRVKLRGTGCRPYNSDTGLGLADDNIRYPDVAIYCDPRDLGRDRIATKTFNHPVVVFEVLSPSTAYYDRGDKVARYREIESVKVIVLVDPVARTFETYERLDADSWRVGRHPVGATLELAQPRVTLSADEMFAED